MVEVDTSTRRIKVLLVILFAIFIIGAILQYQRNGSFQASETVANSGPSNRIEVSAEQMKQAWPLTVDHGWVSCERGGDTLVFTDDSGKKYGINGFGISQYGSIDPIVAVQPPDPSFYDASGNYYGPPKKPLSPLFDLAQSLCK
ncbi:hypothetical protein [Paludibacterium denitrificans]|nr:hypothetical protein [Paludibacterium denitrificans]